MEILEWFRKANAGLDGCHELLKGDEEGKVPIETQNPIKIILTRIKVCSYVLRGKTVIFNAKLDLASPIPISDGIVASDEGLWKYDFTMQGIKDEGWGEDWTLVEQK